MKRHHNHIHPTPYNWRRIQKARDTTERRMQRTARSGKINVKANKAIMTEQQAIKAQALREEITDAQMIIQQIEEGLGIDDEVKIKKRSGKFYAFFRKVWDYTGFSTFNDYTVELNRSDLEDFKQMVANRKQKLQQELEAL